MSLAMTAQSIENSDNNNNSENYIINRKKSNNKTQKRINNSPEIKMLKKENRKTCRVYVQEEHLCLLNVF